MEWPSWSGLRGWVAGWCVRAVTRERGCGSSMWDVLFQAAGLALCELSIRAQSNTNTS